MGMGNLAPGCNCCNTTCSVTILFNQLCANQTGKASRMLAKLFDVTAGNVQVGAQSDSNTFNQATYGGLIDGHDYRFDVTYAPAGGATFVTPRSFAFTANCAAGNFSIPVT